MTSAAVEFTCREKPQADRHGPALKDPGASAKQSLSKRLPPGSAAREKATSQGITLVSRDLDMANLATQVGKLVQLLSDER